MDSREAATPEPSKKLIYNNIYNIPIGELLISQQSNMYRYSDLLISQQSDMYRYSDLLISQQSDIFR